MVSSLAWLDFSAAERERMQRVISFFQESGSVDELGLGVLRDAFSDALFPGTSTIQTRLRYFLFIPWIYQELEAERVRSRDVERKGRKRELALAEVLAEADDPRGAFGRVSGATLKRLASTVYWGGLIRWGLFLHSMSREQYHEAFDELHLRRRRAVRPDDGGVAPDAFETWHQALPPMSEDFPEDAIFDLTREEAEYLQGRITSQCSGSLLAELATHESHVEAAQPWDHPAARTAPPLAREHLDLARRYSLVMHGAALVYNLMLAEACSRPDRQELVERYRGALGAWANSDEAEGLRGWSPDELWRFAAEQGARVPGSTQSFIESWMRVVDRLGPLEVADDRQARDLVRTREMALKKNRSRLANPRQLDRWSGESGVSRFEYRWTNVQTLMRDLHEGLETPPEHA
ncbi:MAG: DUF6361 family protein [Myxococcota bacterium]